MKQPIHHSFSVIGPKGERATIVAQPKPTAQMVGGSDAELVYGLDGLIVEKISSAEFRDFRGTIWTIDSKGTGR